MEHLLTMTNGTRFPLGAFLVIEAILASAEALDVGRPKTWLSDADPGANPPKPKEQAWNSAGSFLGGRSCPILTLNLWLGVRVLSAPVNPCVVRVGVVALRRLDKLATRHHNHIVMDFKLRDVTTVSEDRDREPRRIHRIRVNGTPHPWIKADLENPVTRIGGINRYARSVPRQDGHMRCLARTPRSGVDLNDIESHKPSPWVVEVVTDPLGEVLHQTDRLNEVEAKS